MIVVEVTDQNFEKEVLKSKLLVLVDFWAEWCFPCKMAKPMIEELARQYEGKLKVTKLNVDQNPKTATSYQVMSIPTVIIFREGKELERIVGFSGKEKYVRAIEKALGKK